MRGLLGAGDVIGRAKVFPSDMLNSVELPAAWNPNDVDGKLFSGIRLSGESGDEDGEESERGDESVVDKVVVGEDSADSEI